jgi:hypothetical protein
MDLRPYLNRYVIIGIVSLAGILVVITLILVGWASPRVSPDVGFAPADLTIIPAPTHTPSVLPVTPNTNVTPTLVPNTIGITAYVQINGTEGEGVRVRAAPGLSGDTVFFASEAEVFIVRDGPQTADNYTWWYLVAPYDNTRAGWAVANFLAVIPPPQ